MSYLGLISPFCRLSVAGGAVCSIRTITTNPSPLFFKATSVLLGEPLKKKKKLDPMIVRQREEKRKRRLEKLIKRMEKGALQYKPIEECEVPMKLIDEKDERMRHLPPISDETTDERELLKKAWSLYKLRQHYRLMRMVDRVLGSHQKALDELKMESEELYLEAIQVDLNLVPYSSRGPVSTPPIKNYPSPDGEYQDISKTWG
ncbi:39S ribosomal protein L40, mitochondrial [Neodiprion virginianus]|uniref:39S ribosomal protein L40, mitochondrial n=1 Tax=Neodiprion virginianus TaxID=2961670 RepID=UPI001EE6EEB3|nr:39S ribosomal protein L40, mitochondrial [Neodiprion virginianus]